MSIKRFISIVSILITLFLLFAPPLQALDTKPLSLSDAIGKAQLHNNDIKSLTIDNRIGSQQLVEAESIFIPDFNAQSFWQQEAWDTATLDGYSKTGLVDNRASLSKKNRFGGTTSINMTLDREFYEFLYNPAKPDQYGSHIYLQYVQPLLKDRGTEITTIDIQKAAISETYTRRISAARENEILFSVFYNYFSSYAMTEEVAINRRIREKTKEIHDVVAEKVAMRTLPITDLNKMKSSVLSLDRIIINLEKLSRHRENALVFSIYSDAGMSLENEIVLTTSPDRLIDARFENPKPSETLEIMNRLDPQLTSFQSDLQLLEKDLVSAENDLKSDLSVAVRAGISGYDKNNWGHAIEDLSEDSYHTELTLSYALPVVNTAAKSRLAIVRDHIEKIQLRIESKKNENQKQVYELFGDMSSIRQQLFLSREIVALSEENLDNEIERLKGEKTTVLNVLDYQRALIAAESAMLSAQLDYAILVGTYYLYRQEMKSIISRQL